MKERPDITPPKLYRRFLQWFCDPELLEDVEGDLLELFHTRSEENAKKAKFHYAWDVLLLFRPGIIRNFKLRFNHPIMLRNYILVALRSARKYKGHTVLNLLSLIVGVASCLLILLWLQDELNIDKFHEKDDRLYRAWRNMYQSSGEVLTTRGIPQPFWVSLKNDYPEVEEAALIGWNTQQIFRKDELVNYEEGKYASPELFSIFSFPFLAGDAETALEDLTSIVISESLAVKYFGEDWNQEGKVLGETLTVGGQRKAFKVTGVFEDPGPKSSMDFDWVIPAQEYIQRNDWVESWYNGGFRICFALKKGADLSALQEKVEQVINKNTNYEADERIYLQKFSDNYLYSSFENGRPVGGRIQYVRILSIIAIFILVIACINFMNLATARSSRRAKEIGVRKVMGAQKGALRQQFFTESFVLSFLSVLIALAIVRLILPYFNEMTAKTLSLNLSDSSLWIGIGLVTLVTGVLSGSYPALLMSSFKPITSLKGVIKGSNKGFRLREGLVVFQFALSILLIIGSLVVSKQMDYILNKNLGLDKENLVFVGMSRELAGKSELYKTELLNIPEVVQVAATSGNPLAYGRSTGGAEWEGKDPNEEVEINVLNVDEDFVNTMKIDILKGRDFSKELAIDTANFLINEVTAKIMGFDDPVGKSMTVWGRTGKVVGVVKNFHMDSMYEPIAPLIIRNDPSSTAVAFIRTQGDVQQALESIEAVTAEFNPGYPFDYEFLDREYAASYQSEMALKSLANIFAIISILIACLGLFGLSSFSAEQRSKEIGIRKVYGASATRIVTMLSWGYTKLMLLAFILAAPVAFYLMQQWLNDFEFRTELNTLIFLLAGVITLVIGALTVGIKSWQAALANPVRTLREE